MANVEITEPNIIGTYNAFQGGHDGYSLNAPRVRFPSLIQAVRSLESGMLGVTDTFRWDENFTNEELAAFFGFEDARCIRLEDRRLQGLGNDGRGHDNGVALFSNYRIIESRPVQLGTRQGLLTAVEIQGTPVQTAVVYLDDISESQRCDQAAALIDQLQAGYPSIIMGDLNSINSKDLRIRLNVLGWLRRSFPLIAALAIPKFQDMVQGQTIKFLEEQGFVDSAEHTPQLTTPTPLLTARKGPVTFSMLPLLRLDYLLYRGGDTSDISITEVKRHTEGIFKRASDHYPLTGEVRVTERHSGTVFESR